MSRRYLVDRCCCRSRLGGCAVSPEEDPVQIRMNDLDARVQRIERVLTNQSLLEMAQRIDALQAELRTMRGEVELLQNESEGGKYADAHACMAISRSASRRSRRSAVSAPAARSRRQRGRHAGAAARAGRDRRRAGQLRRRVQCAQGRGLSNAPSPGSRDFVATYPDSPLASNAQYWLGEAYYVTREYQNAIAAFQKVTTDWPDSRKAPDALVKIGFTQSALGRNGDARATLEDVMRRYPGTEAAQLATERLKRLPANAR